VTLMLAYLPVDVENPVDRVLAVHEHLAGLRRTGEPEAGIWAQRLAGVLPHVIVDRATKLVLRVPQHQISTVTTNVPGPRVPLSCLGRRVRAFLPYVPIADRVRLGVAMFSYCDELTYGISADSAVDDLDVLADGTERAWRDLAATRVDVEGPGSA
jgi:diacylglycerol O-acyltransferase